jgi:glycolate oxidase FAD binding subunit
MSRFKSTPQSAVKGDETLPLLPSTEAEAASLIADAASRGKTLSLMGHGGKAAIGRPQSNGRKLSTHQINGITLYEPSEMIIRALAGTPLAEIEATLEDNGQMLPFEPMDYRFLLGSTGDPTLGGLVACNLSGPRRIVAGACRDALIGVRYINGRGEALSAGGRVMKNVTGLDLARVMAGSWGTLALVTEATLKVLPAPECQATLIIRGLDDTSAIAVMARALGAPYGVSGAAHLPAGIGALHARTLIRIENVEAAVDYRFSRLQALLAPGDGFECADNTASATLWRQVRDAAFLAMPRDESIWRLSTSPVRGAEVSARLRAALPGIRLFYDWGGGLIWLALEGTHPDAGAAVIRAALAPAGGHATLIRASENMRSSVDVFQPLSPGVMALQKELKASLDPHGLFNPGRMYRDM